MNESWGGYEINHWLNEKEQAHPEEALRKLKERFIKKTNWYIIYNF